ncbi:MAG: glycosyltransferase family A protein [Planctomycetota bacterium]
MRVGLNPANESFDTAYIKPRSVIVPVYIPDADGYHAASSDVLRICLRSLWLTTQGRASITVIANGCSANVQSLLRAWHTDGWFDRLIVDRHNRGKIDALIPECRTSFSELVTITDADVLFRPGWMDGEEEVFRAFPEAGVVAPVPMPTMAFYETTTTWIDARWNGDLRFRSAANPDSLAAFDRSVGSPEASAQWRKQQLTVKRGDTVALVGAGHFVMTMRREVAAQVPATPCSKAIRIAERQWLDRPGDEAGYWRLSTAQALAAHMGNTPEQWMQLELDAMERTPPDPNIGASPLPPLRRGVPSRWTPMRVRELWFRWLSTNRFGNRRRTMLRLGYTE